MGMRNDGQKPGGGSGSGGFIPTSFKALSSYLRIVSSGASTVASTVRSAASAASAIVERDSDSSHHQVHWAAFDKLECEGCVTKQVLLLGFRHGFEVWDVEDVSNVHNLVSRQDGPVSFMQILPKLLASKQPGDKFADSRPLLIICADGYFPGGSNLHEFSSCNGNIQYGHELPNGSGVPTVVCFYSLRSHSYVHQLKFRLVVHLVRCSSRILAVLQASQIHCFDAATLEMEYNILTNPVPMGCGSGGIGFGPLAVGPRWMAYSGSAVDISNSGRASPQQLTPSASFPGPASNGSLVAHYAKESSKQLAAGLMTLGDMGYKKLSRYYSELLPDGNNSQSGSPRVSGQGVANGQLHDVENVGMVIVRDIVEKTLITQFRAHKSPISSLCFDPSGTLLVTASVQGHNINVFRITPGNTSEAGSGASHVHLYRLQRGFTNAVIQDISFSMDSEWVMLSSSRGTTHLFAISPFVGSAGLRSADACFSSKGSGIGNMTRSPACSPPNSGLQVYNQQSFCASEPPIALSVVSRIRSGNHGWRNTVTGDAAAAAGRMNSLSGVIAAAFHYYKGKDLYSDTSFLKTNCHLLVFSSPGCLIQYAMRISSGLDSLMAMHGLGMGHESCLESDARLVVEAMRKWNICQKQNRKEREETIDIYGENGNSYGSKVFPEGIRKKGVYSVVRDTSTKDKMASEERYHLYISEAELQMHQFQVPLWTKAEIYFQTMATGSIKMGEESAFEGEIEIERIPTRMIEVSSKELVPVFDYLQAPKFKPGRLVLNGSNDGQLLCQRSGVSENRKLACRGNSGSLYSMTGCGAAAKLQNGAEERGWDGLQMPANTTKGFVNIADYPKANDRLEIVNNRARSVTERQFNFVNNSIGELKAENRFEVGGNEFH